MIVTCAPARKEIERGFGRGVPSSDHGDVLLPIGMRFGEVVGDVGKIFAAHAEKIRMVVEAGGDHDFFAVILVRLRLRINRMDDESFVVAGDAFDALVLMDFEFEVLDGATVVFQGFDASGLAVGDSHRQLADFHALGRGEERHVRRIVEERIAEAAFINDERGEAFEAGFDSAGEAGGAGADADDVVVVLHGDSVRWTAGEFNSIARELGC